MRRKLDEMASLDHTDAYACTRRYLAELELHEALVELAKRCIAARSQQNGSIT